jgi:hypothetical protein
MSGTRAFLDFDTNGVAFKAVGRLQGDFQAGARKMRDRMSDILTNEGEIIAELARARIAEMFKNPARMQAAIQPETVESVGRSGAVVMMSVTATGLPYLRIHEYGGVVMTPEIFPRNVQALHWMDPRSAQFKMGSTAATSDVFVKPGPTRAHPTRLPERSYLRYAVAQRREAIRTAFAEAASASLRPSR